MKKTNLILAVIAFLIAFSCSKSSTSSSSSSGQKKVKTVQVYDSVRNLLMEEWLFTYDNNEKITSMIRKGVMGPIFMEINYIDPYNTIVTTYKDSNKIVSKKFTVSFIKFNTNGNVIYDSTVIEDTVVSITNHQYYGDSVWIKRPSVFWGLNAYFSIDSRFKVVNENYSNVYYTYDTKINPLYRLKPIFGYLFDPVFPKYLGGNITSKNNALQRKPIYNTQGDLISNDLYEYYILKYIYY